MEVLNWTVSCSVTLFLLLSFFHTFLCSCSLLSRCFLPHDSISDTFLSSPSLPFLCDDSYNLFPPLFLLPHLFIPPPPPPAAATVLQCVCVCVCEHEACLRCHSSVVQHSWKSKAAAAAATSHSLPSIHHSFLSPSLHLRNQESLPLGS